MKSIQEILNHDDELLSNEYVKNLIEYCRDLEGEIIENKQSNIFSKESPLSELAKDVYIGLKDIKEQESLNDRWPNDFDPVNYKESINNLKKYFDDFSKYNNLIF